MTKDHDVHSLRQMSYFFFDLVESNLCGASLNELINFFNSHPDLSTNALSEESDERASGSLYRQIFW